MTGGGALQLSTPLPWRSTILYLRRKVWAPLLLMPSPHSGRHVWGTCTAGGPTGPVVDQATFSWCLQLTGVRWKIELLAISRCVQLKNLPQDPEAVSEVLGSGMEGSGGLRSRGGPTISKSRKTGGRAVPSCLPWLSGGFWT